MLVVTGCPVISRKVSSVTNSVAARVMRVSELDEADYASLEQALQELRQSCLEPAGQACLVLGENNKLLAMAAFPLHYLTEGTITTYGTISEMLNQASRLAGSYTLPDRDRFRKLVRTELSRAENKCQVLQKEIAAAENAEEYRIKADNLMTYQYALQDHAACFPLPAAPEQS